MSRKMRCCTVLVGLISLTIAGVLEADPVEIGFYRLHNHPDGGARPPLYGLRLDELFDVTGGHDIFTFDFDHEDSAMFMQYTGSVIHIFGTTFGGLDTGSSYDPGNSGLWEVDFTYDQGVGVLSGDDDVAVTELAGINTGTITRLSDDLSIPLVDYAGGHSFTFRLGDENNDLGHRGFAGISGWGWVNHGGEPHVSASDWLFTAELVPEPSAALVGFLGIGAMMRRRLPVQRRC